MYWFSWVWMSSEIYRGHLVRAGQIWRGPRRIYPRDRRMVRNVTVYLSRNKPICRQLQPYRLHFRNSGSKQITHLKDNWYTIHLLTNLLEKNQKTLSNETTSIFLMGTKPPLSNKNRTFIYEIYYEMSLLFEMPRTCKSWNNKTTQKHGIVTITNLWEQNPIILKKG